MNPHLRHRSDPAELVGSLWRNRQLLLQMTKRDVLGRYRGSVVGLAWSFFNPLLMLAVYTFVFSFVFKSRWAVDVGESRAAFAIVLFVGIIVHALLAECVNNSPALIIANANYVKRVVFPIEILPLVALGSALFHAGISLVVLLGAQLVIMHSLPATALALPLVLFPLAVLVMGLSWLICATSVYVRDVAQLTGIFTSALMFLAPVFYPLAVLPAAMRNWLYLNPLTFIIEQSRAVLIMGLWPDWAGLGVYTIIATAIAWCGFWWFQRTRNGFADVL